MSEKKVEDYTASGDLEVEELVDRLKDSGGFMAKNVGVARDIVDEMVDDEDSTNFLSFPACVVSTGMRGPLKELLKGDHFDAVITTCGT
ncbi:MAG: deoxyhypusine synthase family protein, partial [Candidatus Aenigmatarchaeota archaeon]